MLGSIYFERSWAISWLSRSESLPFNQKSLAGFHWHSKLIIQSFIPKFMILRIDGLYNRINFSAAHFIPSIEKCSRLHGHDYAVSIEIEGEPIDGILIDYGIVKKAIREIIANMDHKVLIPQTSSLSRVSCDQNHCTVSYGEKNFRFPVGDVYMLERDITSSEMLADFMVEKLAVKLSQHKNLKRVQLCVYEGPGQCTCQELKLGGI